MKTTLLALIVLGLAGCAETNTPTGGAQPAVPTTQPVDRDNTDVNERDRNGAAKTPINQNENQQDITITADIRKRVVDTKLSVNAQNVKIITQDGKVTLRGPVKSAEEKKQIEDIAQAVAGAGNVNSQLEVEIEP